MVPYQPALPKGARLNTSLALEAQLSNVRLNCRTLLQREILKVASFLLRVVQTGSHTWYSLLPEQAQGCDSCWRAQGSAQRD